MLPILRSWLVGFRFKARPFVVVVASESRTSTGWGASTLLCTRLFVPTQTPMVGHRCFGFASRSCSLLLSRDATRRLLVLPPLLLPGALDGRVRCTRPGRACGFYPHDIRASLNAFHRASAVEEFVLKALCQRSPLRYARGCVRRVRFQI